MRSTRNAPSAATNTHTRPQYFFTNLTRCVLAYVARAFWASRQVLEQEGALELLPEFCCQYSMQWMEVRRYCVWGCGRIVGRGGPCYRCCCLLPLLLRVPPGATHQTTSRRRAPSPPQPLPSTASTSSLHCQAIALPTEALRSCCYCCCRSLRSTAFAWAWRRALPSTTTAAWCASAGRGAWRRRRRRSEGGTQGMLLAFSRPATPHHQDDGGGTGARSRGRAAEGRVRVTRRSATFTVRPPVVACVQEGRRGPYSTRTRP